MVISGESEREVGVEREMKIPDNTDCPIEGNALNICPDMQQL